MPAWDPIILISQIVAIQSLHYLTLAILIPPALTLFSSPSSLAFYGGPANINLIMSWQELAGRVVQVPNASIDGIYSHGTRVATSTTLKNLDLIDPSRGWVIAVMWLLASLADVYYLYAFIRRPRLILDFALTLILNHVILTTYYSGAFPTSMFFWFIMAVSAVIMILLAEQLCVRRELSQEFKPVTAMDADDIEDPAEPEDGADDMELTSLRR